MKFKLVSSFKPSGDQPQAIDKITNGIKNNMKYQTLLGVTGSGKTFTMAGVIEKIQRPTLVISHNKTLAAQLYREFKEYFPHNAVEYFVSYYDYYQPEAYIPSTDTYIEKDASINDEIDRLRLSATSSLMDRKDVIIIASVSFIYGLGSPEDYKDLILFIKRGVKIDRNEMLKRLVEMQYDRDDNQFSRSTFRVRGDVFEIHPAYARDTIRVEMFGDEIDRITRLEAVSGRVIEDLDRIIIYPAKHFVTSKEKMNRAIQNIKTELNERIAQLKKEGKEFEAHRLYSKTMYDIEMMKELGYCNGIENYSRHLSGRKQGDRPATLLDYFSDDILLFVDESHVTLSQIRGMYAGDRSRKQTLVDFGFRLPSALDNRPLKYDEFQNLIPQTIYISATPGEEELSKSSQVIEQIIRPTGLIDPSIDVRPTEGQIDDLISEIRMRAEKKERTLVTTLTKKMSEDLTEYLLEQGIRVRYLHSEIETIERVEILKSLRLGEFDCLVGINLLREGLDLPEVSLVAILDADKIGFLRSTKSLIQTSGRAARHINGHVIMYADKMSDAMKEAINETIRRRKLQLEYNAKNNIQPTSIQKSIHDIIERKYHVEEEKTKSFDVKTITKKYNLKIMEDKTALIKELETKMFQFAEELDFEKAALIRDEIKKLKKPLKK
ncbi:MAG: excinuclease ABC subunit UvrB [Spirochaetota bacterium]|nr:excinuclease ABC subunit UvrB [Spirochaetota bacterium]